MEKNANSIFCKNFDQPDERRQFEAHGYLDLIHLGNNNTIGIGRGVFEPGWRWSEDVMPIAETKSCECEHTGYCLSGTMTIRLDSGQEFQIKEGDSFYIPAGHDAWTEGTDPCVLLDFTGYEQYAEKRQKAA